jgi:alpha-L-fucosidase 2
MDRASLVYDTPAEAFEEALPLGNGRIGAMLFGGIGDERIALNEDSLWSGRPKRPVIPTGPDTVAAIRQALQEEDYDEARRRTQGMHGDFSESYLPAGDLVLRFTHPDIVSGYRRELDLDTGVATVRYRCGKRTFTRTAFVSFPDQLLIARLECSTRGAVSVGARFASQLAGCQRLGDGCLCFAGTVPAHVDPVYHAGHSVEEVDEYGRTGMRFAMQAEMIVTNGTTFHSDSGLNVRGADAVELRVSLATSFNGSDRDPVTDGADEATKVQTPLQAAQIRSFSQLRDRHVEDFTALSRRCHLELQSNEPTERTTVERIQQFAEEPDPAWVALYFNYGRYLAISCSRPGTMAANLQGIWNEHLRPPWSSNYTTNINVQMNYWLMEVANLSECHTPLFDLTDAIRRVGTEVAKRTYGTEGWCCHHNSDIWGHATVVYFCWPMAGPWLCAHFMDRFRFTQDMTFLAQRAWPVMKDTARFCLDWLTEWALDGRTWLVSAPSTSPENIFSIDGEKYGVSLATTMDMSLIRELFRNVVEAANILGADDPIITEIEEALPRLFPFQIGKHGELLEFHRPFDEPLPHHRHLSHLYGAYPSDLIQLERDPELAAAVRRSMDRRGDDATGWSFGWKTCLWARLCDGERAWRIIQMAMRLVRPTDAGVKGGGIYANLFDAHPPFQIDGNLGVAAGIAEMLLQSHERTEDGTPILRLLPALPADWRAGAVTGLCARGRFTVDLHWKDGRLDCASIKAAVAGSCELRYRNMVHPLIFDAPGTQTIEW